MRDYRKFYIDGAWVDPLIPHDEPVTNPATEQPAGTISLGTAADVDRAVAAARMAFETSSRTSVDERVALLEAIQAALAARFDDMADAIREEMGAPAWLAKEMQAGLGMAHVQTGIAILKTYAFEETRGPTLIVKEPIGVCGLITPWNWPLNQIACKVVPALATGCTMVLKPSEVAPFSAHVWAEVLHAAGVPAGVFNLVDGTGPEVGAAISAHPDIDMVSFTGSTRAGVEVAKAAATTVKRVSQELGGKSANILLDDADFTAAITAGVKGVMLNSGQTCTALTRLLAPASRMDEVKQIAAAVAAEISVGDPTGNPVIGPLVSQAQWDKVQGLIETGVAEGATLVAGGPGKPEGLETGYYAKPTIFADVTPDMTIAREEIFGPVLSIIGYDSEEEAIAIANDSPYGLSGGVQGGDLARARKVAGRLRTGQVFINDAAIDFTAPFGGYKQSGNGREWGDHAFAEFLETKAMMGAAAG